MILFTTGIRALFDRRKIHFDDERDDLEERIIEALATLTIRELRELVTEIEETLQREDRVEGPSDGYGRAP
jgi:hypothetical protein